MTKYQRRVKLEKKEFKDKIAVFKDSLEVHLTWYHRLYKNTYADDFYRRPWETKDSIESRSLKDFKIFTRRLTTCSSLESMFSEMNATGGWITLSALTGTITFPDISTILEVNLFRTLTPVH